MMGENVSDDDPHWMCYAELLSILVLSTAMEVPPEMISDLQLIIENYLFHFNHQDALSLPEQTRQ